MLTPTCVFGPVGDGVPPISPVLLAGPATEPVSLAEAKAWLKRDDGDEDDLITALITSARIAVEAASRQYLITQSWRLTLDVWPEGGVLFVEQSPFNALLAARCYDLQNNATALDPAAFCVDSSSEPARILPVAVGAPVSARPFAGIELDIGLGFGPAASDVPQPLRQAILLLLAHWYENRGDAAAAAPNAPPPFLPPDVASLTRLYRRVRL